MRTSGTESEHEHPEATSTRPSKTTPNDAGGSRRRDAPALSVAGLTTGRGRSPALLRRPAARRRQSARLLPRARARGARPDAAALDAHHADLFRSESQDRLLSLGGIPHGSASRATTSSTSASSRRRARRWPNSGRISTRSSPGGRAGARQRRSRAARRLLSRFAGDARASRDRLRHPLRVRHLRPGDPRRLAGGDHRQVAALRQSVGDRQARDCLLRQLGRPHRALPRRGRVASACAGCRTGW